METNRLKTLHLLEMLAEDKTKSQREFSDTLNISLGLVNAFIKRLVKKGYCKVKSLPSNRIKYILTSAGAIEKTRLTYEYISSSYQYFKQARSRLQTFYADLEVGGVSRVVFYGAGELGDIAFLSMMGTKIQLIDVVDPSMEGERFADFVVKKTSRLRNLDFDVVLVTVAEDHETVINTIKEAGIPADKIRFFN
ncbi:MAG: winged helix-turn-helix transcriptional regulator [Desulfosarcina sp.]|nr:winged helix-turn-helix transcriptional regulator [Desulfosarcina sp.]MBC2764930.1 winged helix-turn-helix transcriptional regulator [Desulfosarcina sp.]